MRTLTVLSLVILASIAGAADEAKKDPNLSVVLEPAAVEVWTTTGGVKYHTKDCPSAKIKTNLADAVVDGDTACAKCSPPVYDPAKITVFSGGDASKKYHLFSCRFAKTATTLAQAVADGLQPCGVCKAPALWQPPKAAATPTPATTPAPAPAK